MYKTFFLDVDSPVLVQACEPSSTIDDSLAEIDRLPGLGDWAVAFTELFMITVAACPQIERTLEVISYAAGEDKLGILRDGLVDSLQGCGCRLGLAEAKALYFRFWRGFQG